MEVNKIYNENCLDTMANIKDNFIDLTVTSPPYDNLRTYNGYSFDFESIAKELYRVTKEGGVVVWVVGDATIKGSETGTSFKQALYFMECGFNLHDTMIYQKHNFSNPSNNRYHQIFEYMFVLSKGKPKSFNKIKDRENVVKGFRKVSNGRYANGKIRDKTKEKRTLGNSDLFVDDFGMRYNIWKFTTERGKHPAIFPEKLANDHIISWSNEGDLVYDPFMGSGTTAKMAKLNNRNYIGSEISEEYCNIIEQRLNDAGTLF
jgi:site-specific DNA-methyltransferase (adenine-specific)